LNVLERGEQYKRRKGLYEAKYPATKKGGDKQTVKAKKLNEETALSFAQDTSAKTNKSPRSIQMDVQIATDIPEEIRDAIRDTPVADDKGGLLMLARMSPVGVAEDTGTALS
jgi:hypothetical protein